MRILWKTLIGMGVVFWLALCTFDFYVKNPVLKTINKDDGNTDWMNAAKLKEAVVGESSVRRTENVKIEISPTTTYSVIMWNVVAFFLTIFLCFVLKLSLKYFLTLQERLQINDIHITAAVNPSRSTSKIPVLQSSKLTSESKLSLTEQQNVLTSCAKILSTSTASLDLTRPKKLEDKMEKLCSKLRDDYISAQASAFREHSIISKKLDSALKEKRELGKKLVSFQKENHTAREQLEEMMSERAMLINRLECASKEFKSNTQSKKSALARLAVAEETVVRLTRELESVTLNKERLEVEIQVLNIKYNTLEKKLEKFEPQQNVSNAHDSKWETGDTPVEEQQSDYTEIAQSQNGVEKIQIRLKSLEKRLDKLQILNLAKKEATIIEFDGNQEESVVSQETTDLTEDLMNFDRIFINHNLKGTVKDIEKFLDQNDNLTDEQRRKILDPVDSSEDDSCVPNNLDRLLEATEEPFEKASNLLSTLKTPSSPKKNAFNLSSGDSLRDDTGSTLYLEEDADETKPHTKRMVSQSQAFKRFFDGWSSNAITMPS